MFNLFKVFVVFAALMCIAAAYPSIVGPAIVPGIGSVVVGPVGPIGLGLGLGHGPIVGHPSVLVG